MAWADKYVSVAGAGAHDGSSAANAWTLAEAIAAVAAGNRVNIIAGTYTIAADLAFATAGSTTAPIWWRGYKTTPGDLDAAGGSRIPTTDLPKIVTTNTTDQIISAGAHQIFSNIAVASTCQDSGGAWNATGGNQRFIRCQIVNSTANSAARAFSIATTSPSIFVGCRFAATTTATIAVNVAANARFIGCFFSGGVTSATVPEYATFDYCTFSGFGTNGLSLGGSSRIVSLDNCTIYAAATNGILITGVPTTGYITVSNSIIGGCTNGINNNTGGNTNGVTLVSDQFYACTNNIVGLTEQADVTADLDAALFNIDNDTDPWVAKASANFNLAAAAVAKSAAYPGTFDDPSGTTVMTGYPDIGAVRHIDPSASGGATAHVFSG